MVPSRMIRVLAACSLITLLAACGGEGARDREETPGDRETPSPAEPRDDDDREEQRDEKESRREEDDDDDD
jgi:hypothetical protein